MPSSQFSTASLLSYYLSEYSTEGCQRVYYYLKNLFDKWVVSFKSKNYFTTKRSTIKPRVTLFNYSRRRKGYRNCQVKMQNSDNKEENSQKEIGFITPFQNMSLNQSLNDTVFENALSVSQFTCNSLMEESMNEKETKSSDLRTTGRLNTFLSSSTHSIVSIVNSGSSLLPFDHIWIAQLCTWLHSRGLQHYGATFPNLFTNEVFNCPRSKFIEECGNIDGPHIYDAVRLLYWIHRNGFGHLWHQLTGFSLQDIISFSEDNLTSICGRNDGLRLFYALKVKLTLNCALENIDNDNYDWKVIALRKVTVEELIKQLIVKFDLKLKFQKIKFHQAIGVHFTLDDDLLSQLKSDSEYIVQLAKVEETEYYELQFKPYCG